MNNIKFPAADSPINELFDRAHVAECFMPENRAKIRTALAARDEAQAFMAPPSEVLSVNMFCEFVGELALFEFSADGRSRMLWVFGEFAAVQS